MIPQCSVWFDGGGGSCRHARSVILTKVRIQGYGRWGLWLWILTFVRMTRGGRARLRLWILTFVRMTRVGDGRVCGCRS